MPAARIVWSLGVVSLASLMALASVEGCSGGTNLPLTGDDASTIAAPDGEASTSDGGHGGADARADGASTEAGCQPNNCDRYICKCNDDTFLATDGVCDDGSCDTIKLCEAACAPAKYESVAGGGKRCTTEGSTCFAAQPSVNCTCPLSNTVAYSRCTGGFCSDVPRDACPASCAAQGGWFCFGDGDCSPVVCGCNDGKHPAAAASCVSNQCESTDTTCTFACRNSGGWTGADAGVIDAGPPGPKLILPRSVDSLFTLPASVYSSLD